MRADVTVEVGWNRELREQLDFHWEHWFRSRLEGLADHEYLWEPVAGCWSVRSGADGVWRMDAYADMWMVSDPPPFTTIAWRLCHIATHCLGMRAANHFGEEAFDFAAVVGPSTAEAALALVDDAYEQWTAGVAALGDEGLQRTCGPIEGPYADYSMASLVLHINREVIHHGAEVACLRDLYRDTHRPPMS